MSPAVNLNMPTLESEAEPQLRQPYFQMSEWFGPTIQGEGPSAGRIASFLRLANCNLTCSWCDSKYTWDWENYDRSKEIKKVFLDEMLEIVDSLEGNLVVTGGEPLAQHRALAALMRARPDRVWEVETNGTKKLGDTAGLWDLVVSSPKVIPSADQGPMAHRIDESILEVAQFKFVVHDAADLAAVQQFVTKHDLPSERVWLMPEGVTPEALSEKTPFVIQAAVDNGFNFSSRLHVYGWYDVRGH